MMIQSPDYVVRLKLLSNKPPRGNKVFVVVVVASYKKREEDEITGRRKRRSFDSLLTFECRRRRRNRVVSHDREGKKEKADCTTQTFHFDLKGEDRIWPYNNDGRRTTAPLLRIIIIWAAHGYSWWQIPLLPFRMEQQVIHSFIPTGRKRRREEEGEEEDLIFLYFIDN